MLKDFLIIPLRNLIRHPVHSTINIFGLTVGVTACLAILTIIRYDYSFNRNHPDKERIYRVHSVFTGAFSSVNRGVPVPLSAYIKENFTGIEKVLPFFTWSAKVEIPQSDGSLKDFESQSGLAIAPPGYFDVIGPFEWLSGNKLVLENPYQVVITLEKAQKYFGDTDLNDVIGKTIIYRDSLRMQVAGIIKEVPPRSDFAFSEILSYATIESSWLKDRFNGNWGGTNSSTQLFIKLNTGTRVEAILPQLAVATEVGDAESEGDWINTFTVQPLSDLHFNTEVGVFDNVSHVADLATLQKLFIIAMAILLIAVINFINLETAIAGRRAREVGIRKVLGVTRRWLTFHFLSESYLITLIAFIISVPLVTVCVSLFEEYIPEGVVFDLLDQGTWVMVVAGFLLIATVAGLYPALLLSSFTAHKALKNQLGNEGRQPIVKFIRRGLTIFQFGFSQILIILTIVAAAQINFMLDKDPGFSMENIIYIYTPYYEGEEKKEVFKNELAKIPGITELSVFDYPPIQRGYSTSVVKYYDDDGQEILHSLHQKGGDTAYIDFFGMQLVAGRNARITPGKKETIVNETYAKSLGLDDFRDLIGQQIIKGSDSLLVVGILKDIYFRSLHHKIQPMQITPSDDGRIFGVKPDETADHDETIDQLEAAYLTVYPNTKFNHYFMDNIRRDFYKKEKQTLKLATTSTAIAIIISCLGLFGLASYATIQRTKEIGIRKVLGSSVSGIVRLLTQDFLKYVLVAFLLAIPLGYMLSTKWLEDFAYSIDKSPWIFIGTGAITLVISFLTVAYQSIQVAMQNPTVSLRYE